MKRGFILLFFLFNYQLIQAQAVTIRPETFQYLGIAGIAFNATGGSNYVSSRFYFDAGTIGTMAAYANISLPNGAKIVEITAIYIDNSATQNMRLRLLRQGFTSSFSIATFTLAPTPSPTSQATTVAVSPAYTTNTSSEVYFIELILSDTSVTWPGSSLSINGVIVKYQLN